MCICEVKKKSFIVKDHKGKLYKKHYPAAIHGGVWRLDKIGKDGVFHHKHNKARFSRFKTF